MLPYPLDFPADPFDVSRWSVHHYVSLVVVVQLGLLVVDLLGHLPAPFARKIPDGGKRLAHFSFIDWAFIVFNRLSIAVFAYHAGKWAWTDSRVKWGREGADLWNTVAAFPLLYIIYDFFYTLWHRFLHIRQIYPLIHKHHHRQVVPFRGNLDAVNVHPIEFVSGDYLHLLSAFLVSRLLPSGLHALTMLVFIGLGGILATWNHTRYDIGLGEIYEVSYHDLHHHLYTYNYGQYIMLWDRVFGSYRDPVTTGSGKKA